MKSIMFKTKIFHEVKMYLLVSSCIGCYKDDGDIGESILQEIF